MGRLLLKGILATHADRLAVAFLCSRLSRPLIGPYARRNGIQPDLSGSLSPYPDTCGL